MKPVIIIAIAFVLLIPVSVNAISVEEFENEILIITTEILTENLTSEEGNELLFDLFKNTDYLKTCNDLAVKIKNIDFTSYSELEDAQEEIEKFQGLYCSMHKVWWEDAPEQYSDSECRILISEFTNANTISAKLEREWWVMIQQEREENELYFEETGIKRQGNESDKWLEKTEFHELISLKNSASRDYGSYCSGSLVQGCEEKRDEELRLAHLENPTFDDSVQEKILREYRGLCERDTKLEVWVERQNQLGFTVDTTLLDSPTSISEPICEEGTIEKNGQCVVDETKRGNGGCLIATATYGSELAPQVQQLRELRDNKLLQTESGTSFINSFNDFYYSFSPYIADYERENPLFKEMVKIAITPMISSLSILNYVDMDSEVEVLGYGISLILLNVGMYFVAPMLIIKKII